MARKIFVNLAVKGLDRSVEFFTELGFAFNPEFTDENATCMIVGDAAFVMLLAEKRFKDFTKKVLADPTTHTEAIPRARWSALETDATLVSSGSATSDACHRSTSQRISTARCFGGRC